MSVLTPRMSEKSYKLSTDRNTYVFNVPLDMNRTEVARAIKAQYDVEVKDVTIAVIKGKAVRFVRKGGRVNTGSRPNVKKAYVRLPEGVSLPIFAAVEEEMKATETDAKDTKDGTNAPAPKPKRGLFGRRNEKATKTTNTNVTVSRTQAKIGEK